MPPAKPIRIDVLVINDLVTDNRVHKVAQTLQYFGYEPRLIGRRLRKSQALAPRRYPTLRLKLWFETGPPFYLEFNLRLFFILLLSKAEIILANDLDTLPAAFAASKLRSRRLVYDSHELYTEVPELISRPGKQRIWKKLEACLLPKITEAYTVCDSIANHYRALYGTNFKVVRNLPYRIAPEKLRKTEKNENKIILYQGALNRGRGLELAIEAMLYINSAQLWIAGTGDRANQLQALSHQLGLQHKVLFLGQIPLHDLPTITAKADLGLSLEEDLGLNYRFALPNKLFDYIQHEVPVLVSPLPEMAKLVLDYQVGEILASREVKKTAIQIENMLQNTKSRAEWKENLRKAAEKLCWESEIGVLKGIFDSSK